MPVLNAITLTLDQVYVHLKFQELSYGTFKSLLQLESLSEFEISQLAQTKFPLRAECGLDTPKQPISIMRYTLRNRHEAIKCIAR